MVDINTMSTFTHTNDAEAPDSALQTTNQLLLDPIDPVIESSGQQNEVHGIHTADPSLGGHEILAAEGDYIAANTAGHTEQNRASKAVLDNTIYLPSAAAVAEQRTSQRSPEEPQADVEHIVSAELSQTDPIFGQEVLLSHIVLECSQAHNFEDNLTLVVMQNGDIYQTLYFAKGSPMQWITAHIIGLSALAHADVTLCLQSSNGDDEAFYTITTDEIYATMSAEEGTAVKHTFTLLNEDNSGGVTMTSLVSTYNNGLKALHILEDIEALKLCFEKTGNVDDITQAIFLYKRLVSEYTSYFNSFENVGLQNDLGIAYMRRFERAGNIQDIEDAISQLQQAVKSTPSDSPNLASWCNNLGSGYMHRFERAGNIQDIEDAISQLQQAVKSTPSDSHNLASACNNLGNAYMCRFERAGNIHDIEDAISQLQQAVTSTPSDSPNLASRCNNLGNAYLRRFERAGNIQDIEDAISQLQQAVKSTPADSPNLSSHCINLGNSYKLRFNHLHNFSDLQKCIHILADGAVANGPPSKRLDCAISAAFTTKQHTPPLDPTQCLTYFSIAVDLLAEVAGLEQTIHRRYINLNKYSGLVSQAVTAALDLDRADLALEWLEQGRCLVWNQLGQLRTPIDELRIKNPDLAERFITVATDLESFGSRSSTSLSTDSLAQKIHQQEITLSHTTHATKYKQLLDEIRSLEDFRDFLKPPQCSTILSSIPNDGPIVILYGYDSYCGALALISGAENPLYIRLENFNHDNAKDMQHKLQSSLSGYREMEDKERASGVQGNNNPMSNILNLLWCNVVRPILDALAFNSVPSNSADRPRLWWCPTGPFSFLPLHAAGIYGSAYKPGFCVSDFVVSSYTPTVRSVSEKFAASATPFSHTKLLLVSQPHTPGLSPIPSTTTETHAVQDMMKEEQQIDTLLLENAYATVDRVKSEMISHGWVHFACHGIQNREDPLQSGVSLHDGRLELLEIIRQKIPNPEFAFLSACQTSKGDIQLSDEVVHLAAGMLASGYRGVVGTMWSISDHYGPEFAKLFYQYLLSDNRTGGLDSTRAAYALDDATRQMRERLGDSETAFLTWVPYVHYGY